ncbi:MAG: hypothetical protein Q8R76_04550 [Candidatus Omnitrophota bacterium]|nr:hypothetical protein [Candidatus Omnitrophota bacterium]
MNKIQIDQPFLEERIAIKESTFDSAPVAASKGRTPYLWIFLLSLIAGWVGGMVSIWVFREEPMVIEKVVERSARTQAEKFFVVDKDGNYRGSLGVEEDGRLAFAFVDSEGNPLMVLDQAFSEAPTLKLYGPNTQPVVVLGALESGVSGLALYDQQGNRRMALGIGETSQPRLEFLDDNGTSRMRLELAEGDRPSLLFSRDDKKAAIKLNVSEEGTRGLFFYGDNGLPSVGLMQASGEDPAMGFIGSKNNLIWSTPSKEEARQNSSH